MLFWHLSLPGAQLCGGQGSYKNRNRKEDYPNETQHHHPSVQPGRCRCSGCELHRPDRLRQQRNKLGLTREQCIAFGDGGNDVTMLEYAGIGVAMGNACDAAKAAADYVTDDITADGLAKALAHFGLI